MVVLPYQDRLLLDSRYLQQLIMESLGKQLDLQGRRVEQGLTVYGNKGSTDQPAYVQQLREDIDAYHQPRVEAGNKAAAAVLARRGKVIAALSPSPQTADQIAAAVGATDQTETVYLLLEHLAADAPGYILPPLRG
jgi:glucose-6-phosphate isomerase